MNLPEKDKKQHRYFAQIRTGLCVLAIGGILGMCWVSAAPKSAGEFVTVSQGRYVSTFRDPLFVKTPQQLRTDFENIRKKKISFSGSLRDVPDSVLSLRNVAGLSRAIDEMRTLMMYRATVGVPFADLTLDHFQTASAEAASYLISQTQKITQMQARPDDFPEELYDFAFQGAYSCNQHWGNGLLGCVRTFLRDTDGENATELGRRRWCLNPLMESTGFGEFGNYAAMWTGDQRRKSYDYDFIAFPAKGLTPVDMLEANWAWNVSLHPQKYHLSSRKEDVRVHIAHAVFNPKTGRFQTFPGEIEIAATHVSTEAFGIPLCVIFQPQGIQLEPGSAYCVEITGFSDPEGNEQLIRYYVLFTEPM